MFWLIDLSATSEASTGLNSWARGLLQGIADLDSADHWAIVGTPALPNSLREAARVAGADAIISAGHRGVVQQLVLTHLARRLRADALLAASTVIPFWRRGTPVVSVLHDFRHRDQPERYGSLQRRYRNVTYRFAVRHAQRLTPISVDTARAALREDPSCGARILVVHPGADHVDTWPRPPRGNHAVAFAQWPNKEPYVAISAWARAVQPRATGSVLHVVGVPRSERSSLEKHISQVGAAATVRLRDRLGDDEYRTLFASSALVLLTSSAEGLGLPVLEAMRIGIPVVASDLPAVREVAAEYAWYAPPGDVDAFASAIGEALAAPRTRVEAARRQAARFTWRRCAEGVTEAMVMAAET